MTQLTAEVAVELEAQGLQHLIPQHVAGLLNTLADKLSRPHAELVPEEVYSCMCCSSPQRTQDFYRAWPERCVDG